MLHRNRHLTVLGLLLGVVVAPHAAAAQAVPNQEAAIEVRKQFVADLDTLRARFLSLAEAIPAEKYAWRPAAGVRSVGEAFMHVASELYGWAPVVYGGLASPVIGKGNEAYAKFEKMSSKPEVLKHLKESADYARSIITGRDPAAISGLQKVFGKDRTIIETSFGVVDDLHEHLGQLIAYARMNGITPPWSR